MIVLVCGSRNWQDEWFLGQVLAFLHSLTPIDEIIEGEAPGADSMAGDWAEEMGIPIRRRTPWSPIPEKGGYVHSAHHDKFRNGAPPRGFPALWHLYGYSAGPRRNQEMLDVGPNMVVAFSRDIEKSKGTRDMVDRARRVGVPTGVFRGVSAA